VHSFRNAGREPVCWLETQAPQPPDQHSYRFAGDWDYLREGDRRFISSVVVVGGTSGLGLEIARYYADRGDRVVLTGRDAGRGQ
jgi:hypothetical protein